MAWLDGSGANGTTSLSLVRSGLAPDDSLAIVSFSANGTTSIDSGTPPADWTACGAIVQNILSSHTHSAQSFYKVLDAADAGPFVFTKAAGGANCQATIDFYSDVDTATPIHQYATFNNNDLGGATIAAATVTTTVDGCTIYYAAVTEGSGNSISGPGAPVNGPRASAVGTANFRPVYAFDEDQASQGTTTARTFTSTGASPAMTVQTIAIAPAGGGGPPPEADPISRVFSVNYGGL